MYVCKPNNLPKWVKDLFLLNKPVPCTSIEVSNLENDLGMALPIPYKEFLLYMGKGAGAIFRGSDCFYGNLRSIQVWAKQLLAENNFTEPLPNDAFVFFMHQGYQFSFFKLSDGDNLPIYSYCEGQQENYFVKTDESFGAFLGNELELLEKNRMAIAA